MDQGTSQLWTEAARAPRGIHHLPVTPAFKSPASSHLSYLGWGDDASTKLTLKLCTDPQRLPWGLLGRLVEAGQRRQILLTRRAHI